MVFMKVLLNYEFCGYHDSFNPPSAPIADGINIGTSDNNSNYTLLSQELIIIYGTLIFTVFTLGDFQAVASV